MRNADVDATVTLNGVDLQVIDSGGDLPTVMLLHGLAGHAEEWDEVARCLTARHRVIAFDQRGQGRSTRRPADLSRQAHVDDVVGVAHARGVQRLVLVGQSMGAHTALLTAAQHPDLVERLVLIEGGVGGEGASATAEVIDWFTQWPTPFPSRRDAAAYFGGGAAGLAWSAGLEDDADGFRPRFDVDVLQEALAAVHAQARWQEWQSITCPVTLVRGSRGSMPQQELERMTAVRPEARIVEVAGAGHDVHLDCPEAVAAAILG